MQAAGSVRVRVAIGEPCAVVYSRSREMRQRDVAARVQHVHMRKKSLKELRAQPSSAPAHTNFRYVLSAPHLSDLQPGRVAQKSRGRARASFARTSRHNPNRCTHHRENAGERSESDIRRCTGRGASSPGCPTQRSGTPADRQPAVRDRGWATERLTEPQIGSDSAFAPAEKHERVWRGEVAEQLRDRRSPRDAWSGASGGCIARPRLPFRLGP
jgi:hypothetical protein